MTTVITKGWPEFIECVKAAVDGASAQGAPVLLLVELRPFHILNFVHGFDAGEAVLSEALERLIAQSNANSQIFRVEPGKLAIVVEAFPMPELLTLTVRKLKDTLSRPYDYKGESLIVTPYLGVSVYPHQAQSAEAMISEAEISLHSADSRAINVFQGGQDAFSNDRVALWKMEKDLDTAIHDDRLFLQYQPKLNMQSMRPDSSEALMRWILPDDTMVSPAEFIPVAESSGVIHSLTDWGIMTAVREISEISTADFRPSVSVNLSAHTVYDPALIDTVKSALAIWGMKPEQLILEITESVLVEDPAFCFRQLTTLMDLGVNISIDDFGTGYSSLAYFKSLPATEIKIDQAFVKTMGEDHSDAKIIELIIDLSHKFGMSVVAEGVETRAHMDMLKEMGCDYAQGYYIGRPMKLSEYRQWLSGYQPI
ncbi:MAG: hypothetical protein CMK32_05590 [Porticoccaceae bacterium]|nr:hypothetical protein [Porticoccaceae bacterium]